MPLVFAVLTSNPGLLRCELRRLEGQVRVDGPAHATRGAGSFSQGEVLLRHLPQELLVSVRSLAPREDSGALVYVSSALPPGLLRDENTQPFRFRSWLFAHDGAPTSLGPARAAVMEALPLDLRRLVQGETDGELAFLHFLAALREVGHADDRMLPAADASRALLSALARLDSAAGGRGAGSAVGTDGRILVAVRGGERPLHYTVLEGSDRCEVCGLTGGLPDTDANIRAHRLRRTVAVATHLVRSQGWLELPPRTAVAVDVDLQVRHVTAAQP